MWILLLLVAARPIAACTDDKLLIFFPIRFLPFLYISSLLSLCTNLTINRCFTFLMSGSWWASAKWMSSTFTSMKVPISLISCFGLSSSSIGMPVISTFLRPRPAFCEAMFSARLVVRYQLMRTQDKKSRLSMSPSPGKRCVISSLLGALTHCGTRGKKWYSSICLQERQRMGFSVTSLNEVFYLVKRGNTPCGEVLICWSSFPSSSHVDGGIDFLWAGRSYIKYNMQLIPSQVAFGLLESRTEIGTSSTFV